MNCSEQTSVVENQDAAGRLWVGLDVGGTKIEGVAVDDAGRIRGRVLLPTAAGSTAEAVESISGALEEVLRAVGPGRQRIAGVGLGIPGMVEDGVVSLAVNLKLESYPLANVLSERFGVPVTLENDVRAAALGAFDWLREERLYVGHRNGCVESMVYLSLGTGISCGVILDGRLHRGANGMAGEVGHAVLDPGGARCKCGMQGCFETIASGPAIARQGAEMAETAARNGTATMLRDTRPLTAETVFAAAQAGDALAQVVVERVAYFVARAVYNLIMYYDVEVVALGGGVSHAGAVFFTPVRQALERLAAESPLARQLLYRGEGKLAGQEKVILVPRDNAPAWRGMIRLAKTMDGEQR